ncbi:ABC transporter substrate-binding protein [Ktedonobacter racemifer]|uniref:Extracellular solute-binding protein family 1 n=1 Tax=Ktedonobacter racemifer DSM 44963 TaxID=485913 RepID=D6U1P1_KTERA|nr:ABC transporter substrate-binding protein [Ktedonobacter racemifer]EFH82685.1 extracellular solute-binding protein family 1 [Ktedonobacter racemifer DSM 44963]
MSLAEIARTEMDRRLVLKLLGVGAMGAALAACGGGSSANSGPYKGKFVIMSANDPAQNQPLIKGIEAAFPGGQVVWRGLTSERFVELFTASEVAHDQIDLLDLNGQDLRRYAVGNRLLTLDDFSHKDRFVPVALKTYTVKNKLQALARGGISGFTFFYNKKLLAQVGFKQEPQTYDDLRKLALELKKIGVAPFVHAGKDIYLWPVWMFWALAQTSNNQSVDLTFKTLTGSMKFTDPEYVAALELIYSYAQDGMFIQSVNNLDSNSAVVNFTQGKAAFFYTHSSIIGTYRKGSFPNLDLDLVPPLLAVSNSSVKREMPGGTGSADAVYAKIAPERKQLALNILDLMTNDKWSKWASDQNADPASCNKNVQASADPLALKYAHSCAPIQNTYLDWYWPPEITQAFQQNIQGLVSETLKPDTAAQKIQQTMDGLRQDGYTFAN